MKRNLITLSIFFLVLSGFGQNNPKAKPVETPIPKVDFSYAFGTPHRITVGQPTNGNRTLLDLEAGKMRMTWNYADLTQVPIASWVTPEQISYTWSIEIKPEIDGQPVEASKWTRLDGFLPALDNSYDDPHGKFRLEVIGGETAAIGRVEVVNTDVVPHQYRLSCANIRRTDSGNQGWTDPGRWTSDCLYACYYDRADRILLMGIGADRWSTSPDGKAPSPNAVTFIWDIKPGEKRTGYFVRPYKAYEADLSALRRHDWVQEFDTGKKEWYDLINRMKKVTIPDTSIINALKASFSDLFIMREPVKDGYTAILPGTHVYRAGNPTEPSIAGIAINQFGLHQESAESQRVYTETQGADGNWSDPQGWMHYMWWTSGVKAWAIIEHYLLTGDKEYLGKAYPHMLASSRFQESQRARTRVLKNGERQVNYGLLPRGVGDCGLDNNGDWYGIFIPHNIWAVYADSLTLVAARALGKTNEEKELEQIYRTAKIDLLYTMDKGAIQEDGYRWIPGMANNKKGSRWGVLNSLFPCHLLSPNHELITGTIRYMEKNMSKGGVPLHTGFMENGSWVAMALDNLAEAYLARGNGDKAAHYLYTTLNHCTPLFTNCEERGQEPGTHEAGGDLQHAWTPIAVVRIIRDMLLMEDGDGLNLALGTDRSWLASGKPVGATDMPSHFGNVTYQMQYDPKKGTVTGEIKMIPKPNQTSARWTTLHIRLPEGLKVKSVDKASRAKVLTNGEGIRWEGPVTEVRFGAKISK